MLSKKTLHSAFIVTASLFLKVGIFAQCLPLKSKHLPVRYHRQSTSFFYTATTAELIEHSKTEQENELKKQFNLLLDYVSQMKCYQGSNISDQIFLFQTSELLNDSMNRSTRIIEQYQSISLNSPINSITYDGIYQRDISIMNDSVQITNWYIKHFKGNELLKMIQERNTYTLIADSLNLELHKIKTNRDLHDWRSDARTKSLRAQRTKLLEHKDSIDFLLYPSLLEKLKPWYKSFHAKAPTSPASFEFSSVRRPIVSDKDPFLEKTFKLHHAFVNDPYSSKSVFMGDSTLFKGAEIYTAPVIEDDYSPWDDPHVSFYSLGENYLVVFKDESNIGETFLDYRQSYFVYQVQE